MARFLWICLGGALGTGARYLLGGWIARAAGPSFPWGTLAINLLGSSLLGFLMQADLSTGALPPTLRLALTTGVMGGFTTYSTFNYETLRLFQSGAWDLGAANIAVTVIACLAGGIAGMALARGLVGG